MDIASIRTLVRWGKFYVTDHAFTESFKDGISFDEMVWAIHHGKIIEDYPLRSRCLVLAQLPSGINFHVVVDYSAKNSVDFVTAYIPSSKQWIRGRERKGEK